MKYIMSLFHQIKFLSQVHPPILALLQSAQPDNIDLAIELLHTIPELALLRQQLLPDTEALQQLQMLLHLKAAAPKQLYRAILLKESVLVTRTTPPSALAALLRYAINLRSLIIRSLNIKTLPYQWKPLHRLEEFHLEDTPVTSLPSVIYQCKTLKTLWLPNNKLQRLSESIGQLTQLEDLELSDNQLTKLPKSLTKLTKLTQLNVADNQLQSLPPLYHLNALTTIDASDNWLTDFPKGLEQATALGTLSLSGNRLHQVPSLKQLHQLSSLDLSRNRLGSLPDCWDALPQLNCLYLNDNPQLVIPPSLLQLKGRSLVLKVDQRHAHWRRALL